MTKAAAIRHDALPPPTRRGLHREESAAYIGVSPSTWDKLVDGKLMPQPKRLFGRVVWDVRAIDEAFDALPCDGESADAGSPEVNEWD